jgi:hypothetical protein
MSEAQDAARETLAQQSVTALPPGPAPGGQPQARAQRSSSRGEGARRQEQEAPLLALGRCDSLTITDDSPNRAVVTLAASQKVLQLPLDARSAVLVEDNEGEIASIAIEPPPQEKLGMRTLHINEEASRKTYTVTFSLPVRAVFHTHASIDSGQIRLISVVDVYNDWELDLYSSRVYVSMGGLEHVINDFELHNRAGLQLVFDDQILDTSDIWLIDLAAETVQKALQFELPARYAFAGNELPLAGVKNGGGIRSGGKLLLADALAWLACPGAPEFDFFVDLDAVTETLIVQLNVWSGENEGSKKTKRKPRSLPLTIWLLLPEGWKTTTCSPQPSREKMLNTARSRKMLEFTIESAGETRVDICAKWSEPDSQKP